MLKNEKYYLLLSTNTLSNHVFNMPFDSRQEAQQYAKNYLDKWNADIVIVLEQIKAIEEDED